ncbi:hypothetical protein TIFTF001_026872 [Ficus carica]|uniref:Uncharacterized protein n=1 Tax=Ficus carica TaxID=3494 RepID=A0AA88IZC1_FICCA|nr:hypothetical protein TIFTF001_026872 [Ficus carica]
MEAQNKTNQKFESLFTQMVEESKEMKTLITKLTGALAIYVQEQGKFPSQAQSNPKRQHMVQTSNFEDQNIKEVNAITTRSGKILDDPSITAATSSGQEVIPKKDEPTELLDLDDLFRNSESKSSGPCELANNATIYKDSQGRGTKFWQPRFKELP